MIKIGNVIITTTKGLTKIKDKAKADFIENEFPKMQDEIWNTAIDTFKKTPVGSVIASRKELESENERLKNIETEYNNILWAIKLYRKFIRGE